MALTVGTNYLEELARKRARAEALQKGMLAATSMGVGVLDTHEQRGVKQANDQRDYDLRLKQHEDQQAENAADNLRLTTNDREQIRQFNTTNASRVNRETLEGQRQTTLDAQARENADRTYGLSLRGVEGAEGERTRNNTLQDAQRKLAAEIGALDGARIDRGMAEQIAQRTGASVEEVMGAATAAATARGEKNAALDLNTRKTEAQIELDRANAARARRPPASSSSTPKPRAMSDAGVKNIANVDNQINTLRDLVAKKDSINLGPVDTRINDAAQALGFDDPKTTRFRADVGGVIDAIISDLSGAAVPKAEWDRLKAGLPSTNDNDSAYKTKLEATLARIEGIRTQLGAGYRASGRPVPTSQTERMAPIVGEASALGTTGVPDDAAAALDAMTPEDLDALTPEQAQALLDAMGG